MDKCGFRFHHTEEGKTSPLGDVRTEHFMRMTKEEWESAQHLSIRPLTEQDIPEMRELFRATVLTVNSKDYTKEEVEDWASCGDSVEHWKELFAKNDYVGALDGQGNIIGFSSMNAEGYLHSMFVHKDWQGKGVATLLLSEVEKNGLWIRCTQNKRRSKHYCTPFLRKARLQSGEGTESERQPVLADKLFDGKGCMNILKSLIIWFCFIPAAILNGGLREYALTKAVGEELALPVSGITLSMCIFLITWLLLPRMIKAFTSKDGWLIGIGWALLTIVFEFAAGLAGGCFGTFSRL